MSSRNILIYMLAFLLIGSNLLWLESGLHLRAKENEPTRLAATSSQPDCCPGQVAQDACHQQLFPLIAAVRAANVPGASRDAIAEAAQRAADNPGTIRRTMECMERGDVERVGAIGLEFDGQGRLRGATTTLCPY